MLGFLGKVAALPIRLVNVPLEVADEMVHDGLGPKERAASAPLNAVAKAVERAVSGEDDFEEEN